MVASRHGLPSWMSTAASRVDFEGNVDTMFKDGKEQRKQHHAMRVSDANLGFGERALSAAGAAFVSAILVNPLDVAKVRNFYSPLGSYIIIYSGDFLEDAHFWLFVSSSFGRFV